MTHELRCSRCNKQISVLTSTQLGEDWFCPHDARETFKELQIQHLAEKTRADLLEKAAVEWKRLYEAEKAKPKGI